MGFKQGKLWAKRIIDEMFVNSVLRDLEVHKIEVKQLGLSQHVWVRTKLNKGIV